MSSVRPLVLAGLVIVVAATAWAARELNDLRLTRNPGGDPSAGWVSFDPDSQYHMRRLSRLDEEGYPVAERDPRMNFPHGAPIPWPPYYTIALDLLLPVPIDTDEDERRSAIENGVASVPCVLAVICAALLAWLGMRYAAPPKDGGGAASIAAGLVAGGTYALLGASLEYSVPGIGDHHAWVVLLSVLLLALTSAGLAGLDGFRRGPTLVRGAAAGAVAGLLVGSWVGGLVYVLVVELALGWMLFLNARTPRPHLASLGLAFHLALVVVLAPAVLSSPWKDESPWLVVNLSWFHLALPMAGALVFLPLLVLRPTTLAGRAWSAYPWIVAGLLVVAGIAIGSGDFELARGVREGFAWAGRANTFMAFITESQPLLWGQMGGPAVLFASLGYGVVLAPVALVWAGRRALFGDRPQWLPWVLAAAALGAQALFQRRFADAFGAPMALLLGLGAGALVERLRETRPWIERLAVPAAVLLVALSSWPTLHGTVRRMSVGERWIRGPATEDLRGVHDLYRWLRTYTPAPSTPDGDYSVLASWDHGHGLEWIADRASVATNFGSYLGEDSYLDPWRFFLDDDSKQAEQRLIERRARYLLITSNFTKDLEVMLRLLRPDSRREYLVLVRGEGPRTSPRFYTTMAARLMLEGRVADPSLGRLVGDSLGFLRLVRISPQPSATVPPVLVAQGPQPVGWIWEHVPGARLEASGEAGTVLEVELEIEFPGGRRIPWIGHARTGSDGVARLRVPYCTDRPNGFGGEQGGGLVRSASFTFGQRSGTLEIPEADVLSGATLQVP